MITTELKPQYDSCKSFYSKAKVIVENNCKKLLSYETIVAEVNDTGASINGTYSATSLRHIKEFLKQEGFEVGTKKFLEKTYLV